MFVTNIKPRQSDHFINKKFYFLPPDLGNVTFYGTVKFSIFKVGKQIMGPEFKRALLVRLWNGESYGVGYCGSLV